MPGVRIQMITPPRAGLTWLPREFNGQVLGIALLCGAYYLGSALGRALIFPGSAFSIVWPPNTVLLVALLLSAPRRWLWLLLIAFPVHVYAQSTIFDSSLSIASMRYVTNCIFALLPAAALRHFKLGYSAPNNLRQALVFACVISSAVALAALGAQATTFLWTQGERAGSWSPLFLSNLLPFLIATPCLITGWSRGSEIIKKASVARCAELAFLAVFLLLVGTTGFVVPATRSLPVLFFAPVPLLIWAAVRFGASGLSFSFVIFSLMAIFSTVDGFAPFGTQSAADSVFRLQIFLLSLYVPLFGLASVVDERRLKEDALKRSEVRYRAIVEDQTELICRLLPDGTYTFVNDAYCKYFGHSREALLGNSFWQFLPPEEHQAAKEFLASLTPEHAIATREHEVIALHGEIRWQQWQDRAFFDETGRVVEFQAVGRDITEQKMAEAALRESEERFRVFADTAPVMVWMSGTDKRCTDVNGPWLDFTGRPIEAELGDGWTAGIHPDDVNDCLKTYGDAFDRREPFRMEYRLRHHDGEYRWILDAGMPRNSCDGSFAGYIGSALDVTEQKQAQATLSSLNHRLMEAHEEERTRIARELHDDICQRLVVMTIQLHTLSRDAPADIGQLRTAVSDLSRVLAELGRDIQAISHRLHSSKLDYVGIVRAADGFCEEMCKQHAVKIDFSHEGIPANVPGPIAIGLFRVLQEALQNAIKHSDSQRFTVRLRGTANEIQLEVIDHGSGFDLNAALNSSGLGLISMRERLSLIHGKFSIESSPGAGTTVRARVPFSALGENPAPEGRLRSASM